MTEEVVVQGEQEGGSLSPIVQEEQTEAKARKKGWKPETEWKGEPEDWVDAKEYLGRQKLFDRIDELKGELGRVSRQRDQDIQVITSHFEKMREADYQRAKEEVKSELKAARKEGDVDAEEAAEAKLEQLEEQRKAQKAAAAARPVQQNQGPTPEFQTWQKDNGWFGKNTEMTQEAIAIGTGYAALHPNKSQTDVLKHVSERIQKLYPEEFDVEETDSSPSRRSSSTPVESGNGGSKPVSNKKSKSLSVADLTQGQREVMRVLIKRGALKTKAAKNKISQEEQYLRDIEEYEVAESTRQARRQ